MSKVLVETSARHVHVSEKDLETLFGPGYQLTVKKMLSQPGQYACAERVDVVGEKKTRPGVSILGPCRKETQVELSLTDARSIGVKAPIRESGDLEGSGACKLVGPKGEVVLEKGVIAAILGSIVYRFIYAIVFYTKIVPVECLKLLTAVIVALAIASPSIRRWFAFQKRKMSARTKEGA